VVQAVTEITKKHFPAVKVRRWVDGTKHEEGYKVITLHVGQRRGSDDTAVRIIPSVKAVVVFHSTRAAVESDPLVADLKAYFKKEPKIEGNTQIGVASWTW
jgi:hypothetical protein